MESSFMINQISSDPSLPKRGITPPFGKGRLEGILQSNKVIPDFFVIPACLESFFKERSWTSQDDRELKRFSREKTLHLNPKILEPFEVTKS
jgi:hypothetical protein